MQLPLAISPRAPGMRKAPRAPALIASPRLAQRGTPRLCAAFTAAVASPSVAHAAHQHFGLAACADEHSRADGPGLGPAQHSGSRHRRSGSSPESALRNEPNRRRRPSPSPWTSSPAGAILRMHSWLTRWGAADETTARSSRLPRPFYNTAQFYRVFASAARPRVPPRGLGEPPGKAFVIQDKPAAAISAAPHASRVLHRGHATNAARAPCRPSASNRANALTPGPTPASSSVGQFR
jgi:hypothetical protein